MYLQNDKLSIFIAEHHMVKGIVVALAGHSNGARWGCRGADSLQGLARGTGFHCEIDSVWGYLGEWREEWCGGGGGGRGKVGGGGRVGGVGVEVKGNERGWE